jgi:putative DNA primase/helicase
VAYTAAARTVWTVVPDPDDDSRRLFLPAKNNLADSPGMAFTIESTAVEGCDVSRVVWEPDPVTVRLDNLHATDHDRPAFDEAQEWLKTHITEPMPASDVLAAAKKDGLKERTLKAAKKTLGIQSQRHGDNNVWHWFPAPTITLHKPDEEVFIID